MKVLFYIVIGLLVIISVYFIGLSVSSRKQPDIGMTNGQLRACPATPNCVSSEEPDASGYVRPLTVTTTTSDAWEKAKWAVVESGSVVVSERDGYLHAHFVTILLRYVDDLELRFDEKNQLIHIRSASRVGRSDFGANRVRVEMIRAAFVAATVDD